MVQLPGSKGQAASCLEGSRESEEGSGLGGQTGHWDPGSAAHPCDVGLMTSLQIRFLTYIHTLYVCMYAQSPSSVLPFAASRTPGSSAHGILQARILKWVAISSSRRSS